VQAPRRLLVRLHELLRLATVDSLCSRFCAANQCGGLGNNYCPSGSAGAASAPDEHVHHPIDESGVPAQQLCQRVQANRQCAGGLILAGVDYSTACPGHTQTAYVYEATPSADFGPVLMRQRSGMVRHANIFPVLHQRSVWMCGCLSNLL
jgi:hypothetical protein